MAKRRKSKTRRDLSVRPMIGANNLKLLYLALAIFMLLCLIAGFLPLTGQLPNLP
jgi:hypothetical protein